MSKSELRAYVLERRDDQEALHADLDKLHAENPSSRVCQPDDDVAKAIAEYTKHKNFLRKPKSLILALNIDRLL